MSTLSNPITAHETKWSSGLHSSVPTKRMTLLHGEPAVSQCEREPTRPSTESRIQPGLSLSLALEGFKGFVNFTDLCMEGLCRAELGCLQKPRQLMHQCVASGNPIPNVIQQTLASANLAPDRAEEARRPVVGGSLLSANITLT